MLSYINVGDKVRIYNKEDFPCLQAGFYEVFVVDEDPLSFAVASSDKLWFSRYSGKSYIGNATVVEKVL